MGNLKQCHPRLQTLAEKLVEECKKQGYPISIGETFRTVAEQNALYAQGRTKPGQVITNAPGSSYSSMHQWGVAFDIYRNDGNGAFNESGGYFQKVGTIGKSLGLEWGGDWHSIVDKPHFQLPDWGSTPSKLKSMYGNVYRFKETWYQGQGDEPQENTAGSPGSNTSDSGKDTWVRNLQEELVRQGYHPGTVDGIPGPNTLVACPTVKEGARGGITRLIQQKLSREYKIGISASGEDGIFGEGVKAAVMEFQKQNGLGIDGIVGKKTWEKLLGLS